MTANPIGEIMVQEIGPQKFALSVTIAGQTFACGQYLSRAAAQQAGKLFLDRKAAEQQGQRSRPRKK